MPPPPPGATAVCPPAGQNPASPNAHARYRALLNAITDAVFVADGKSGRLLDVNEGACQLLGLPADKIIGLHHTMLHPPQEHDRYAAMFQGSFQASDDSGHADIRQIEILRADGTTIPCEVSGLALDENGRSIMFGIFRDRRNQQRSEHQLRVSEERYSLALGSITEGIWDWAPATNTISYSDRCLEILGYAPGELPHDVDAWRSRLHPTDAGWVRATLRQCADGLLPSFSIEYRLRHKDGGYRWIRSQGTALRDESGNIVRLAGGNTDITARKEAEQALRESEQRFRLLVENSPDAFFLHTMEGTILDVNQRACDMLGYDAAELRALHIYDIEVICPPETLQTFWRDMRPGPFSFDGLGRRKDGTTFPSEVQGVAFIERGRLLGLVATRDITPRKKLEKKLKQARDQALAANQAKSEFLASMGHEIRTPLNILLGMTDLLRETLLTDRQRQYADTIESSGNMLLRLIDDLLDLSRVEANRIELHPETIAPRQWLYNIGEAMRIPIEQKGLALTLNLADNLPERLRTDPARLQQILLNLLWNAIKFTPQGGIELGATAGDTQPEGSCLRIFVADTGIGIAADQFERIFEPFTQVDASTRRQHGGTGLGLTICNRLAKLLGGHIQVASTPGQGSRFTLTLPCNPKEDTALAHQATTTGASSGERIQRYRLLLVEDSLSNQELIKLFLEDEPCDLVTAATGTEALSLFADQTFDLVLMDMEMPGMDGCETTMGMRRQEQKTDALPTPILMLTAHAFSEYETKCRQAGCDGFLSKPIRKAHLVAEVRRHILAASRPQPAPDRNDA